MHCRTASTPKTLVTCVFQNRKLLFVNSYRYIGLNLNEYMNFSHTASILAAASSRALGVLTNKYYKMNVIRFETYKKLFDTCALPVLNYGSEMWGHKHCQKLETVLHRLIKQFLETTKTTPLSMILDDFGEYLLKIQRQLKIIKYWLHIISFLDSILLRVVYVVIKRNNRSWCHDVREILTQCDMEDVYLADGHPYTDHT